MRMTRLAAVVSSVLLGASLAHAGDDKMTDKSFSTTDKDGDGAITLAEAQAGMPKLADKFASVDSNSDGKVSADEFKAHKWSRDKSMEADQPTSPPKSE